MQNIFFFILNNFMFLDIPRLSNHLYNECKKINCLINKLNEMIKINFKISDRLYYYFRFHYYYFTGLFLKSFTQKCHTIN